jgi:hypothetical protein
MTDFCFSIRLSDKRELCLAPVSRDAFEANGAHALGDDCGYFIERPSAGIEILAKAASYEAAGGHLYVGSSVKRATIH